MTDANRFRSRIRNQKFPLRLHTAPVDDGTQFAVLFRKPNKSGEALSSGDPPRVDSGERHPHSRHLSANIKRAKARVVECPEGEDSTRALAGLLAQRTAILERWAL
jgi:hypothetical protein